MQKLLELDFVIADGDVFRSVVPLNESYFYDYVLDRMEGTNDTIGTNSDTNGTISDTISTLRNFSDEQNAIINLIRADVSQTQKQMQKNRLLASDSKTCDGKTAKKWYHYSY